MESRSVFAAMSALEERAVPAALATVIRVRGSAYRHEGAKLLIAADGSRVGNVSGGCLEADVCEVALRVIASGRAERRSYCSGTDVQAAWDLGVGCDGEVELWMEPVRDSRKREREALLRKTPFHVLTRLREPSERRVCLGEHPATIVTDQHGDEWFADPFTPPPTLLLAGAGDDAVPLARMAVEIGFHVIVCDRRPGLLAPDRFPSLTELQLGDATTLGGRLAPTAEWYAVVMHHHYADDGAWLALLLDTAVSYIGMLGPRARTDRLLAALPCAVVSEDARVHGPVGLDIGTDGAEQVALSILAEIMAYRTGRQAQPLRERGRPIHADAD